jgi:hypothetical protein
MAGGNQEKAPPGTLTQAFEEAPLPQGTEILAEIHLLAWSLVGSVAGNADWRLAMGNVTDLRDGFIHTVYVQNGAVVGEGWHDRRADGSGRRYHDYHDVPEDRRALAREVRVDISVRPASGRLRRMIGAVPEPELIQNALDCADRAFTPYAAEPGLLEIYHEIMATLSHSDPQRTADLPQLIFNRQKHRRRMWSMDARATAAARFAAQIPAVCAAAHEDDLKRSVATYRELVTVAADRLRAGWWDMTEQLVAEAVAMGYAAQLDKLGADLLAEATRFRDAALEAPPEPVRFAGLLYDAAPPAFAAAWLSRSGRKSRAVPWKFASAWAHRETIAEEMFVRISDGLWHQAVDWITGSWWEVRRQVAAARARGDRRAVWTMLRDGEFGLRWPRSFRPFLSGEGDPPVFDPRSLLPGCEEAVVEPDEAVFAVADALGPDFVELAPDGEAHFDPSSIALIAAASIVSAACGGVLAGIRQAAQGATSALIQSVAQAVRRRLSRERVTNTFTEVADGTARDAVLDAAAADLAETQRSAAGLGQADLARIVDATAAAVRQELEGLGLSPRPAERVQHAVSIQLAITINLRDAHR